MVAVRGLSTYVETSGAGQPLLYLHGAAEWVGYSSELVRRLDGAHRVIQPERRGHGRTADPPGPLSYDEMTADTIALIERLGLEVPPIVGFSDGAIIALQIARLRPDLSGPVVAIGPNVSVAGLTEDARRWLESVTPETWPEEFARQHRSLSPDGPEHWPVFVQKVIDMLLIEPEIPLDQLAAIRAPVLVMGADHDLIRLEHLVEIHRAIPGSELCIVPGASHELTVEAPDLVATIVERFLADGPQTAAT
jgi:pimeloyl-ACP methyl ester carboxylesterase